ncbi:MAG: hypothetical protein EZS28_033837, partial [Streblomastix strix]
MRFPEVWTAIGAEKQVIMGIMPLLMIKNSTQILKNKSHLSQPRRIMLQYNFLLQEEIRQKTFIQVNPLYVKLFSPTFYIPKRDGSYRKIFDASAINQQKKKIHFKMISPFDAQQVLLKNSYLTSIDIKSAFNYITIHPSLELYLGFEVEDHSFVYICMPYGLRFASIVFTKTLQMALAAIKKATVPIEPPHSLDSITTGNSDQITGKIDWKVKITQIPISAGIISSNQVESLKGQSSSQTRMGFDSSTQAYNLVRALLVIAILKTNASRTGWGVVLELDQSELLQASSWKKPLSLRSSNQREAGAIRYALRKFKQQLAGIDQLKVQTDNQVAVMNLQRKAFAAPLATTMRLIFQEATQMGLMLHAVHIKGDKFATQKNTKCTINYSPTQEDAAAGTGGLQAVWSNETIAINPPLILMNKVVQKLRTVSNCTAVVIAMNWSNQWLSKQLQNMASD